LATCCPRPYLQDPTTQSSGPSYRAGAVEARYAALCASKPGWTFTRIFKPVGTSVADVIIEYTTEQVSFCSGGGTPTLTLASPNPDPNLPHQTVHTLVFGADGVGAHALGAKLALGSNSDALVKGARCNVICTQAKGRMYQAALSKPPSKPYMDSSRSAEEDSKAY
jgi:hypothetical protein